MPKLPTLLLATLIPTALYAADSPNPHTNTYSNPHPRRKSHLHQKHRYQRIQQRPQRRQLQIRHR